MRNPPITNPALNEPFQVGRDASRLLFDLGIACSCIQQHGSFNRILDFASGSGWIAEWLNRMGFEVVPCDIAKMPCLSKNSDFLWIPG